MYDTTLLIHSWLRWILLLLGVILLFISFKNWKLSSVHKDLEIKLHWFFMQSFRYQVVFGILLFLFLSPLTTSIWSHPENILENPYIRFWVTQHMPLMLFAIGICEAFYKKARRESDQKKSSKHAFISTLIVFILMMLAIPWPFLSYGRSLFKL